MPKGEEKTERLKSLARQLLEKEVIINGISDSLILLDAKTYKILDANQSFSPCLRPESRPGCWGNMLRDHTSPGQPLPSR